MVFQQVKNRKDILCVTCKQLVRLLNRNIVAYVQENGELSEVSIFFHDDEKKREGESVMEKRMFYTIFHSVCAVCIVAACVLSIISSNKAYSLSNINLIIAGCVVAFVVQAFLVFGKRKMNSIIVDVLQFISVITTTASLCLMIAGRSLLMGYVYFSDLESGNPVAVSAMNLAVVSWVFYLITIVCMIVLGFKKENCTNSRKL